MSSKKAKEKSGSKLTDPIVAFIVAAFGKPDTTAEKNLREMVGKFSAHQGEFFLFIRREQESFKRGLMPPQDDFSYIKTTLYLCIIEGELRFGEAGHPFHFPIRFPHAVGELMGNPKPWGRNVFEPEIFCSYEILMSLKQQQKVSSIDLPGFDMAIGNEEAKALIIGYQTILDKHHGKFPLMIPVYKMCLLLGRCLHNFPEQEALLIKDRAQFAKATKEMGK
ncbi:MAG: hypothetical protein NT170_01260 [Candidatus Moranbacteria bacterium]|nr:hypothetical protein [Candidatus Moranbacteria bacterium]